MSLYVISTSLFIGMHYNGISNNNANSGLSPWYYQALVWLYVLVLDPLIIETSCNTIIRYHNISVIIPLSIDIIIIYWYCDEIPLEGLPKRPIVWSPVASHKNMICHGADFWNILNINVWLGKKQCKNISWSETIKHA